MRKLVHYWLLIIHVAVDPNQKKPETAHLPFNLYGGHVRELGKNWSVYNLKSFLNTFKKLEGISVQKRIYIIKKNKTPRNQKAILIKAENTYRANDPSKKEVSLLKKGKTLQCAKLEEDSSTHGITQDKRNAVNILLKQAFGDQWYLEDQFGWYFEILRDHIIIDPPALEDNTDGECHCIEEENEQVIQCFAIKDLFLIFLNF
ncbi:hypothetical protein NQ314_020980 [Rhamnusium bicolor]|uniref:Uncharacterized protein n=1 Tax=Rhamnusium bicolor TaxID=1586634 RepID=A0AAV8WK61_9CUCU|nr:hypothetical protein NQ314_020980 [Rhamnusium bicolor]